MTFDEILADQVRRLPPSLRSQLRAPTGDSSQSLVGGGVGLGAPKAFVGQGLPKVLTDSKVRRRWQEKGISEPFRDSDNSRSLAPNASDTELRGSAGLRPRDLLRQGGLASGGNVIIQGNQGPPAPASSPSNFGEALQVAQAGLATANTDLAPLLSDWRTSPAAALAAAVGGYGRGSYAAQKDLAAGRVEKQKADREAMQLAAQERLIAQLPEDQRLLAQLDPGAFAQARIKQAFPDPIDPGLMAKLGLDQQQFEAQMGFNQQKESADQAQFAAQQQAQQQQFMAQQDLQLQKLAQDGMISQQELAIRRAALAKEGARAPEALETVVGPDGKPILVPRSQAAGRSPFIQGRTGAPIAVQTPEGKTIYVNPEDAIGQTPASPREAGAGFNQAKDLRTAFEKQTADARTSVDAYRKIDSGFAEGTGPGDVAGVFGYMKLLDPTSVVREGEFATAANSAGISESLRNTYNKLVEGDKLSEEARNQIKSAAGSQLGAYKKRYEETADIYGGLADSYTLDRKQVVTPLAFPEVPKKFDPASSAAELIEQAKQQPQASAQTSAQPLAQSVQGFGPGQSLPAKKPAAAADDMEYFGFAP